MDIADKVAAALQTSVLPSVIARGGEIRVLRVEGDTVVLEVTGSPGAALPLLGRIEALIGRLKLCALRGEQHDVPDADHGDDGAACDG